LRQFLADKTRKINFKSNKVEIKSKFEIVRDKLGAPIIDPSCLANKL